MRSSRERSYDVADAPVDTWALFHRPQRNERGAMKSERWTSVAAVLRMCGAGVVSLGVLGGAAATVVAQTPPKYGVTVTADKDTKFGALKTYVWTAGQPSFDKNIDRQIVAAVDRELSKLGLSKQTQQGDVLVTYVSQRRTDVELKSKTNPAVREFAVGVLLVDFLDPRSRKQLLRLRIDKPIEAEAAQAEAAINEAVAEMFAKYPTRAPQKP
jgi:uncharacterized protein DUF4136